MIEFRGRIPDDVQTEAAPGFELWQTMRDLPGPILKLGVANFDQDRIILEQTGEIVGLASVNLKGIYRGRQRILDQTVRAIFVRDLQVGWASLVIPEAERILVPGGLLIWQGTHQDIEEKLAEDTILNPVARTTYSVKGVHLYGTLVFEKLTD